ncbi:MAG: hypothetical protein GEU75_01105 [Dehalococcoidia bacterium]|nr:hypothetical protein [Dehalococcoidia bacterium]
MEERQLLTVFEGPLGKAEVYEILMPAAERPEVFQSQYEILFEGKSRILPTMGEASLVASSLSGDPAFQGYQESGQS